MPTIRASAVVALAISWCAPAHACTPQEKPAATAPAAPQPTGTPAQQFEQLKAAYDKAMAEFDALYEKAKTEEERRALFAERIPKGTDYAPRAIAIAKAASKDPVAVDALLWTLDLGMGPEPDEVLALFVRDHLDSEKLGEACTGVMHGWRPAIADFLRAVLQRSPHRGVQGNAAYGLATWYLHRADLARGIAGAGPAELASFTRSLGAAGVAELKQVDIAAAEKEADTLLDRVVRQFGDVKGGLGMLGEAAAGDLFQLRNLSVGKVAPDIEAEDVDGVKFKLSDYRGKVVFLDFWGFW